MVQHGFEYTHDRQIVTLFSAPNYCYRSGNQGAIMEIQENLSYGFVVFDSRSNDEDGIQTRAVDYFL